MSSMTRISVTLSLVVAMTLGGCYQIAAQRRPKYQDVLPGILVSEPASAVAAIKSYLEEDPEDNASQYLQLGLIYHKRFESSDPLKDYHKAMANIQLTKDAFERCWPYINEREVARRDDEYLNFGTYDDRGKLVVNFDSIPATMDRFLALQAEFEANVPPIYDAFTKSYLSYSKANHIFSQIVGRYKTLKDLYLLYNDDLKAEFDELKRSYEESIRLFDQYKSRTANYPIGYNQQLSIREIKIYRLDGLDVEVNFLQDEIPLWNYAQWVDEIQGYVATEISGLRRQMEQNERLIATKLKRTEQDFADGSYEQLQVDKEFLFTLRKFDLRSVVEPLFKYKEFKHAILHQEHWAKTIDADTTSAYDRKISSYGRMVHNIRRADTVLQEIMRRDVKGSYEKYSGFIDEYYHGIEGIKRYANQELANNRQDFDHYIDKIQQLASQKFQPIDEGPMLRYRKKEVPDFIVEDEASESTAGQLFTTHMVRNIDNSEYLGGVFYSTANAKKGAFVCKKEPNGKISWFKELWMEIDSAGADANTELAVLYAAQTGCTLVLNGTHTENQSKQNVILAFDENGNRIMQHRLDVNSYPRSIDFVQRTHSYMVTFKGEDRFHNFDDDSELYIDNINDHGESVWETGIGLTGNVTGVVVVEDGYLISGNYQTIEGMDGQTLVAPHAEATFLVKLDARGKRISQLLLNKDVPYYTDIFFKTGDHAVHLFGSTKGHGNDHIEADPSARVHFIVTRDLHVVADSFE